MLMMESYAKKVKKFLGRVMRCSNSSKAADPAPARLIITYWVLFWRSRCRQVVTLAKWWSELTLAAFAI